MCNEIAQLKRRLEELEKQNKKLVERESKNNLNQRKREVFNSHFGDTQSNKKNLNADEIRQEWKNREALLNIVRNLAELIYKNKKGHNYSPGGNRANISTEKDVEMYIRIYEKACINISTLYF